jgi:hypothetical protein
MEKHCPNCNVVFTPRRAVAVYCSEKCQQTAAEKRRVAKKVAARPTLECHCGVSFVQKHSNQKHCSPTCALALSNRPRPASPRTGAVNVDEAARLLADGFFLADLVGEIERVAKTPGIVASLEAALVQAIADDALWPVGKPGRIAVVLALLKNPSLARVRWRHVHEQRRIPGVQRKPSGIGVRAYGMPGSRV